MEKTKQKKKANANPENWQYVDVSITFAAIPQKVYCGKCSWYVSPILYPITYFARCMCDFNLEDTYSAAKSRYIRSPAEINKDNNCPWFERKRSLWQKLFGK